MRSPDSERTLVAPDFLPAGAMRLFTLIVSVVFTIGGVTMAVDGDAFGWLIAGFFGLCFLTAVFEPRIPKPWLTSEYRLIITDDAIACEHPKRKREAIRWKDVKRIWYVTTSDGPRLPDEWILLEGSNGGCSFPTEAQGMDHFWDELKARFPGFDYGPLIHGGTGAARHLCWDGGA